jgi:hypothetical protein
MEELLANPMQFVPDASMSPEERWRATTRFMVYATALTYALKRDVRVLWVGVATLGAWGLMRRAHADEGMEGKRKEFIAQGGALPTSGDVEPFPGAQLTAARLVTNPREGARQTQVVWTRANKKFAHRPNPGVIEPSQPEWQTGNVGRFKFSVRPRA